MKKTLYVGLEIPAHLQESSTDHCPLIAIQPRPIADPHVQQVCNRISRYTHVIFTSKSAVSIFFTYIKAPFRFIAIAVGSSTAAAIRLRDSDIHIEVASEETAEGVVELLASKDLTDAAILWPHSALSRPLITDHLRSRGIACDACVFYDTYVSHPQEIPNLDSYDEIYFTSPSTIDAFIEVFGNLPEGKVLSCIGPVTERYLNEKAGGSVKPVIAG